MFPISILKGNIKESINSDGPKLDIPKEIYKIVESFKEYEEYIDDLFRLSPSQLEIENIRIALDNLSNFDRNFTIQSLFSVLIELLDSMPKPIIH